MNNNLFIDIPPKCFIRDRGRSTNFCASAKRNRTVASVMPEGNEEEEEGEEEEGEEEEEEEEVRY